MKSVLDLKGKTRPDLLKLLAEQREHLRQAVFGGRGGQKVNVRERRQLRRNIARVLTALPPAGGPAK